MTKANTSKRGRPKKIDAKKNCIKSWLTDDEIHVFEQCVNLDQTTKSEFIRSTLLEKFNNMLAKFEGHNDYDFDNYDEYFDEYDDF